MQAPFLFKKSEPTPKVLKWLLAITVTTSLLAPIVTFFLNHSFNIPGPLQWFSLSLWGLLQTWLWQPLTYFFIQSNSTEITLSLFFSLLFWMSLLWITGKEIILRYGTSSFLLFYLGGGIFTGLLSWLAQWLFSSQQVVYGSGPPVFATLLLWTMLFPNLELFFFILIRIEVRWLVAILVGLTLLIHLLHGEYFPLLADLFGLLWGFSIGKLVWKLPNPYPLPQKKGQGPQSREGKIINITPFQESDEEFMDRMLDKISRHGESSLTSHERSRLDRISKK
ncbi:MAG: hypothetical protein K940chlam9_01423 [Chlamydiae bacterium]|nr:hypothetical protein [Chlamydiota bacterium]